MCPGRSAMRLLIQYSDAEEKWLFYSNDTLPRIACSIHGGKLTVTDDVKWSLLKGDMNYTIIKNVSKLDLLPKRTEHGFGVFLCTTKGEEKCLTKIILLGVISKLV